MEALRKINRYGVSGGGKSKRTTEGYELPPKKNGRRFRQAHDAAWHIFNDSDNTAHFRFDYGRRCFMTQNCG